MSSHFPPCCLGALAAIALCTSATAAPFHPSITVLRNDIQYEVQADGRHVQEELQSLRINTESGVHERGQATFGYSASLQELEVVEAYTTSKEGHRLDVAADKVLTQQSPQSAGAPTFDDGKVKTIIFPSVEVGARLTLRVRTTQKIPLFPGQFHMLVSTHPQWGYESRTITVKAPTAMKLSADARGWQGGLDQSDQNGQQVWRWSLSQLDARAPELNSVSAIDHSPRLAVSSFSSYAAVAQAYQERAKPRSLPTPTIRKLAEDITEGIPDRRAQADALYRWVTSNVRYVAILLEFGGVVPRAAEEIVATRYGDCKDHTALLEALLAAKGIASSAALVNAGDAYTLPTVALPVGVFDHAISYLPEFKMFVDSTAGLGMFGVLSAQLMGKQALVVDNGEGQPELMRLPVATPQTDRVKVDIRMVVGEDGTVHGKTVVDQSGIFDLGARQIVASFPAGMESQVAAQVLTLTGQSGTGIYWLAGVRDLSHSYRHSAEFWLPELVQLPGPGAMTVPAGLSSFSNIAASLEPFSQDQRNLPLIYPGRKVSETITLKLPTGLSVTAMPKPLQLMTAMGQYETSYQVSGQEVVIRRDLDINVPNGVLAREDYPELRKFARDVQRSLRRQLVY